MVNNKKQGKINRAKGKNFELRVRKDLEEKGFIVDKWGNNINLETEEFKQAGNKYIPGRGLMPGLGFPDFVALERVGIKTKASPKYNVKFIECKTNNILSKIEKLKLNWMLKKNYDVWVAYEEDKEVKYRKFQKYIPIKTCK